jgi:hypothetical protein
MLKIDKISTIVPYSDEFWTSRLGRMTGCKISCICGERGIGEGGLTYIRSKVGELISGKTSEVNVSNESTIWGITNEPLSLKCYQAKYNVPIIITDKHLIESDRYAVTPDGLIILKDFGDNYDCETLESKSFPTYATHIEHCECETALDIKKINKPLYWQVIMQMYVADTLVGNACFFHPDFPEDSELRMHRVVFRKTELFADFKIFKQRLSEAETIFNNKYEKFKTKIK